MATLVSRMARTVPRCSIGAGMTLRSRVGAMPMKLKGYKSTEAKIQAIFLTAPPLRFTRATSWRGALPRLQTVMDAGLIDRSRFLDREVLDPHRVMETSRMGGASASAMAAGVGQHSGGNLDFLKQAVDLGVRKLPLGLMPGACAR